MTTKFLTLLFLISSFLISQPRYKSLIKAEQERHKKMFELSKIQYPGDSNIDVTYYGLNFKITNTPQYISGSAIINIKVAIIPSICK